MAITTATYCSREDVKAALDFKEAARNNTQIDRAIEAASIAVDALCHRKFYPEVATKYFDWPNYQYARSWRLWLDANEVISVTSLVAGGTTISSSDYFLEPANYGPPYSHIEIDLSSSAAFSSNSGTHQRSVAITGTFGYNHTHSVVASAAEAINASETQIDVNDSSNVNVGDLFEIDDEHMICVEKSMLTTGQTLQTPLTASMNDNTVAVATGGQFHVGETLLLDSERMLIVDIAGNSLTVRRSWDGSTLAAHTGSTIYAPRTLTMIRGAQGSTAASHLNGADVEKVVVPALIRQLAIAEAVNMLLQESNGFARTSSGESNNPADIGRGLQGLRDLAKREYGRKVRIRGV